MSTPSPSSPEAESQELQRTLGLVPALAIGTGTMVGAGIFVFPGLAAGKAGPAAMLPFAIGAVIALLVNLALDPAIMLTSGCITRAHCRRGSCRRPT